MRNHLHALITFPGRTASAEFDLLPRRCPCCGETSTPWRLCARSIAADDSAVDFAFQCSRLECRRVFVVAYRRSFSGEYTLEPDDAERWCDRLLTLQS